MEIVASVMCIVYIAALSAGTSYFLNFAFGFPLSDSPNAKAIFFKYSVFLAKWRMKRQDRDTLALIEDYPLEILRNGRTFWTWEYIAGMCVICSNVWLSLILYCIAVYAYPTLLQKGVLMTIVNGWAVILLSHLALRKPLN